MLRLPLRCVALWTAILLLLEAHGVQAGTVAALGSKLDQYTDVVEETPSMTSQLLYPTTRRPNSRVAATDASVASPSAGTSDNSSATPLVVGGAVAGTASLALVGVLSFVLRRRQVRARMADTSSTIASTTVASLTHSPRKRDRSRPRLPKMRSLTVLSSIGHARWSAASESLKSPALSCFSAYDDPFSSSASTCDPCSASHIQAECPGLWTRLHSSGPDTPSTPSQPDGNSSETHSHEEDIVTAASLSRSPPFASVSSIIQTSN
ncbi:hypothetical protein C8Q80DRAFT_1139173 [Daedaleopsis nitida]|nr:hypothetical protein C8Q80DRAFT_1139173 [Daedaleopsis nitida]